MRLVSAIWPDDFGPEGADIELRYGLGNWPGVEGVCLGDESLLPVCSPAVASGLREPADLASQGGGVALTHRRREMYLRSTSRTAPVRHVAGHPWWSDPRVYGRALEVQRGRLVSGSAVPGDDEGLPAVGRHDQVDPSPVGLTIVGNFRLPGARCPEHLDHPSPRVGGDPVL